MQQQRPPTSAEDRYLRAIRQLSAKGKPFGIGAVARKAKRSRTAARQAIGRLSSLGLVVIGEHWSGCEREVSLK